jgi:hypothetical protein
MPKLIFHEVTPPLGPLADWIKQEDVKVGLILQEEPIGMGFVLGKGYAPDLNDVEIEEIGKDPFLIAATLAAPDRVVVTKELSRPSRTRARRMAPDVCKDLGIEAIDDYRLYKILKFSIP